MSDIKSYPCIINGPYNERELYKRLQGMMGESDHVVIGDLVYDREKSSFGDETITISGKWCDSCPVVPIFRASMTYHLLSENDYNFERYSCSGSDEHGFVDLSVRSTMSTGSLQLTEQMLERYAEMLNISEIGKCLE